MLTLVGIFYMMHIYKKKKDSGLCMIPIRSVVVSAVLLSKIESEIKLLLMKRVKGDYWCHVAGKVEEKETASQVLLREIKEETAILPQRLFSVD